MALHLPARAVLLILTLSLFIGSCSRDGRMSESPADEPVSRRAMWPGGL